MNTGDTGSEEAGLHTRQLHIGAGHPAFDGHFPGTPILPGVALLAEVFETVRAHAALTAAVGPEPQLGVVKFTGLVPPGTRLTIACRLGPRTLAWQIDDGTRNVASGEFARADLAPNPP